MRLLIDTCVLSEIRHPSGNQAIKNALTHCEEQNLFISALTIGEIAKGIFLLSPSVKKNLLMTWLEGLKTRFSDRILSIDHQITYIWGEMTARAKLDGRIIPVSDGLIAATALRHGLHVITRNVRHFEGTGVFIVDPKDFDETQL